MSRDELLRLHAQVLARGASDGTQASAAGGWVNVGPTTRPGHTTKIAFHPSNPDLAYVAAADGGVWRLELEPGLAGWTWTPLFDQQPTQTVDALAVDPVDPRRIYVGTGYSVHYLTGLGLIRSRDGGQSWLPPVDLGGAQYFQDVAVRPDAHDTVLAATSAGLWRSLDAGDTWERVLDGYFYNVVFDAVDPVVVWTTDSRGVLRSEAGGDPGSFLRLSGTTPCTLPSFSGRHFLALSPSDPAIAYLATARGVGEIYRTDDAGLNWCPVPTPIEPARFCWDRCHWALSIGVEPDAPDRLFTGGVVLHWSDNAASTWTGALPAGSDQHVVRFHPLRPRVALTGGDHGVFHVDVSGSEPVVTPLAGEYVTAEFYGIGVGPLDPDTVFGGTQDNGPLRLDGPGRGATWMQVRACGDGGHVRPHPTIPGRLFYTECPSAGRLALTASDDGGRTSVRIANGINLNEGSAWAADLEVPDPATLYVSTNSRIWRTRNLDAPQLADIAFQALAPYPTGARVAQSIAATPADPDTVWAAARGLLLSRDGGQSWTEVFWSATGHNDYVNEVIASPTDRDRAWVVLEGNSTMPLRRNVWETTDGGQSWSDMSGDLPEIPVRAIQPDPLDPDRFWIGTRYGVFVTEDHGATWVWESSVPTVLVTDLQYQAAANAVYAGTFGRGIWRLQAGPPPPPRPVPDGAGGAGLPLSAVRQPGGEMTVHWDPATCPGNADYHLFYGPLERVREGAYSGAACGLGRGGTARVAPPDSSLFFLMSGSNVPGDESGHRRASGGGWDDAQAGGLCPSIRGRDLTGACP